MRLNSKTVIIALVVLAVAVGFSIRASAGLADDSALHLDAAFHIRMTQAALDGTVRDIDHLRLHPIGTRLVDMQPVGLYQVTSAAHHAIGWLTGSPESTARVTTAIWGALIALPVFAISRRVWGSTGAGVIAAFAIAVIPAHVLRTMADIYRLDALGTLLAAIHVLTVVRSLCARSRFALSSWPVTLSLILLLAVWRAGVAVLATEMPVLLIVLALPGQRRAVAMTSGALLAGFLVSGAFSYMSSQHVLTSRVGLTTMWMAASAVVVGGLVPRFSSRTVLGIIAVVGTVAVLGRLALPPTTYDLQEGVAFSAVAARLGIGSVSPFLQNLYQLVAELRTPGPGVLWESTIYAWCSILAIVGMAGLLWRWLPGSGQKARDLVRRISPDGAFVLVVGVLWFTASMLFDRSKVLGAIPVAIASGGVWRLGAGRRSIRAAVAMGAGLVLILTGTASARIAANTGGRAKPMVDALCTWIAANTSASDAVLCDWSIGYSIQTHAGRPSFTDGYLEHPLNRTRIHAVDQALMHADPDSLHVLCEANDLSILVFDAENRAMPFVRSGDAPLKGGRFTLPASAAGATAFQLAAEPPAVDGFEARATIGPYRVFRVVPLGVDTTLAARAERARVAGDWASAAALYRRLADESPRDVTPCLQLGYCLLQDGANQDAKIAYEEALRRMPTSAAAANGLAWTLIVTADDLRRAVTLARQAVEAEASPYYYDTLARAHLALGDCDQARAVAQRAQQLVDDPSVIETLMDEISAECGG